MPPNSPFVISFPTPHQSMLGDLARPSATWLGPTLHLGKGGEFLNQIRQAVPTIFFQDCSNEVKKWNMFFTPFRCHTGRGELLNLQIHLFLDPLSNNSACITFSTCILCYQQGSLKGESVVAAILSSRMEQSYCTSGVFRFQARFLTSSAPILTITHYLRTLFHPTRNLTHLPW